MKYILCLLLACLYSCSFIPSNKCLIGSLPSSPTQEEILAQKKKESYISGINIALREYESILVENIRRENKLESHLGGQIIDVIEGDVPFGVVYTNLIVDSKKVLALGLMLINTNGIWHVQTVVSVPLLYLEE